MSIIGLPQLYATLTPSQFTATAAQTTFTPLGGYTAPYVMVMANGAMLGPNDYTAADGINVVLNTARTAGDQIAIWSFGAFNVASPQFPDNGFLIYDNGDTTKKVAFDASAIATGTTRTVTVPDVSGTMAYTESGTFTATLTGCTTSPTYTVKYAKVGKVVTIEFPDGVVTATSNATTKTFTTDMPASIYPGQSGEKFIFSGQDNGGGYVANLGSLTAASSTITLSRALSGTSWTNSGAFYAFMPNITYLTA